MSDVFFICEGASEKLLVERILTPYFRNKGLSLRLEAELIGNYHPDCQGAGGDVSYERLKIDLDNIIINHQDAYITTIFDYYGLKGIWPGLNMINNTMTSHQKAKEIEDAMSYDLSISHFIPNLLVHELEGLLFTAPEIIARVTKTPKNVTSCLQEILLDFNNNPEDINDDPSTAPSIRLKNAKANYGKIAHSTRIIEKITIDAIRKKCPHFNAWLEKIESIS